MQSLPLVKSATSEACTYPKPSREACSGENFLSLRSQDLRLKPVVEAGEFFEACEVFEPSKLAASEACT
jgi:hypothetical protein